MILVLTGSIDGTSDLVFHRIGADAFRLNFDLFADYDLELSPHSWRIRNPAGLSINHETVTGIWWWKAFNYRAHEDDFVNEEVKCVFRELYSWGLSKGLVKGTPPDFHNRNGKIALLDKASTFFKVVPTLVAWGFERQPLPNPAVAKSLSSGLTTSNRALFTQAVDTQKLDPKFPWYLQHKIESVSDVTVFICGEKLFSFSRDRSNLKGLDWRAEINFSSDSEDWSPRKLTEFEQRSVINFCKAIGVDWGRIDFLESENKELIFLEYNANGQWVFLDINNKYKILDAVADYLSSPSKLGQLPKVIIGHEPS